MKKYNLVLEKTADYNLDGMSMKNPKEVNHALKEIFNLHNQTEETYVLLVGDSKGKVIGAFEVSRGSLSASIVHPREIFKRVFAANGSCFIDAHNHPSGNLSPSDGDIKNAKRLRKLGDEMDVQYFDSFIVGPEGDYLSMVEQQIL